MASGAASSSSIFCKVGLKPFNRNNVLYYYAPLQGIISYSALSINVMNPPLLVRAFPKRDLTNILLFNTLLGAGLYIYSRPHIQKANGQERALYSTLGACLYCFGSVLIWAIGRSVLPRNLLLCTMAGIGSGILITKCGRDYLEFVDNQVAKR